MNNSDKFQTLLYIASYNRSGSTLLDLLLGNHKCITSIGELVHFYDYRYDPDRYYGDDSLCTCGKPFSQCPFWQRVENELNENGTPLCNLPTELPRPPARHKWVVPYFLEIFLIFATLPLLEIAGKYKTSVRESVEIVRNCWLITKTVSKITGASVIVDSSKRAEQLKLLYLLNPDQFKLVFLVRDGRGATASSIRRSRIRGKNLSTKRAALSWLLNNLKLILVQLTIPKDKRLRVKYEDLCRDPEQEIQRICHFAGLPFDGQTLVLSRYDRHNIGGSPHRFDKGEIEIKLDERWKHSLSSTQLTEFNRIAGFLNKLFGYSS